jgi:hypothetical protein
MVNALRSFFQPFIFPDGFDRLARQSIAVRQRTFNAAFSLGKWVRCRTLCGDGR